MSPAGVPVDDAAGPGGPGGGAAQPENGSKLTIVTLMSAPLGAV